MTRKTLKIHPETKARLVELKQDGETFDGLLNRAAEALEEADTAISEQEIRRIAREAALDVVDDE